MFRVIHILACLTVFTTALPQGWCCWLIRASCCADQSAVGAAVAHANPHGRIDAAECHSHCCESQRRNTMAANNTSLKSVAGVSLPASSHETDSLPFVPTKECCQREPLIRALSFDFLVNPLIAATSDFETGIVEAGAAIPFQVDTTFSADSIRLHARLGRWLC